MKKTFIGFCAMSICLGLASPLAELMIQAQEGAYTPGSYESSATGYLGDINLTVTIDESGISDIQADHNETEEIGGVAIEELIAQALEEQTTELEVVSGATVSSEGFITALNTALGQASGEAGSEDNGTETSPSISFNPGTYTGVAEGMGGEIHVEVVFSENRIESIEVIEDNETSGIGEQVFAQMPEQLLEYQSLDVDIISGATVSSVGLRLAIEDAIQQAEGDVEALRAVPMLAHHEDAEYEYDVVIAGGGLAGLTAALKAAKEGATVALIEKTGIIGGTAIYASGNIIGADEEQYVQPMFEAWLERSAIQEVNPVNQELVQALVEVSPEVMELMYEAGVEFNEEIDEEDNFQTFRAKPNEKSIKNTESIYIPSKDANKKGGAQWMEKLHQACIEAGVDIYINTPATELIVSDEGVVTGVISNTEKYGNKVFNSGAVVLATGDYARNEEMTAELAPQAIGEYSATAVGNTGEGITMALEAGAVLTDYQESMSGVFNANPYDMPMIGDPTNGYPFEALLLNNDGVRVYKEDGGSHPQKYNFVDPDELNGAWCIMDAEIGEKFHRLEEYVEATANGDQVIRVYKAESIEELAEQMGLATDQVQAEVDRYNELVEQGEDTDFGKAAEFLSAIDDGTYYAAYLYDATRGNYGGIVTNVNAEVVDENGDPIEGLYASGTISSGEYFGDYYPGRQALGIASHMGYVSGEKAAEFAAEKAESSEEVEETEEDAE